jgi:malate dehydrogenase
MKIVIVGGAGGVGASTAFNLLVSGGGHEVVLVDRRPEMITSHVMDLEQVLPQVGGGSIRGGDAADLHDADVVILTAAIPPDAAPSRMSFLRDNAVIVSEVTDALPAGWDGVLLLVTNPVEPLLTWVHRRSGIDRRRLVGYTANDSLRLRTGVAMTLDTRVEAVDAWMLGEHGDACFALWDRVRIEGAPATLTSDQRVAAEAYMREWFPRHVALASGRTSTWTSGLGLARMVAAIDRGTDELWPAAVVLDGEYGFTDIALTVPSTLGHGGVTGVVEWALDPDQTAALQHAGRVVQDATADLLGADPSRWSLDSSARAPKRRQAGGPGVQDGPVSERSS